MRINRYKFFMKTSALVEGGFDGTLGSEKYTQSILAESKNLIEQEGNLYLNSHLADATKNFDFLDIDVYILDQKFFGTNNSERYNAIQSIKNIFNYHIANSETLGIYNRITTRELSESKDKVILQISREIDNGSLTDVQISKLAHLVRSIVSSKRPFFLYIYDNKSQEDINLNGLKHDAMHLFKDVQIFNNDKDETLYGDFSNVTREKFRELFFSNQNPSTGNNEAYSTHPLGVIYVKISKNSNNFIRSMRNRFSPYITTRTNGEIEMAIKKALTQSFFARNYKEQEPYLVSLKGSEWPDHNHDIMQSIVFSHETFLDPNYFSKKLYELLDLKISKNEISVIFSICEKYNKFIKKIKKELKEYSYNRGMYPSTSIYDQKVDIYSDNDNSNIFKDRLNFLSLGSKNNIFVFLRVYDNYENFPLTSHRKDDSVEEITFEEGLKNE